jgi:hypothetical protein
MKDGELLEEDEESLEDDPFSKDREALEREYMLREEIQAAVDDLSLDADDMLAWAFAVGELLDLDRERAYVARSNADWLSVPQVREYVEHRRRMRH